MRLGNSPNFIDKPARTRTRQIGQFDRSLDRVTDFAINLFLMGTITLTILGVSAIAYKIWDLSFGWVLQFEPWVFPMVGAIIFKSQLSRSKAHLHITNLHKDG